MIPRFVSPLRSVPRSSFSISRWNVPLTMRYNGFASEIKSYETILVDKKDKVGIITLHRPQALNALCIQLFEDVNSALSHFEKDEEVGAVVITGSEKAFAAGADIKEMSEKNYAQVLKDDMFSGWADVGKCRKPIIAAVSGHALGGGCEVSMMCDIVFAGENARFGQPEVGVGTVPGAGGTQRLVKAVGKSMAMEMVLGLRTLSAAEAEKRGLVSRVIPGGHEAVMKTAMDCAKKIASLSQPIVGLAKEAVNRSFELPLSEGLLFERRAFHSTFGLDDRKRGMDAFVNKAKPDWKND